MEIQFQTSRDSPSFKQAIFRPLDCEDPLLCVRLPESDSHPVDDSVTCWWLEGTSQSTGLVEHEEDEPEAAQYLENL